MAHFFEIIKNNKIDYEIELAKIMQLVDSEEQFTGDSWETLLSFLNRTFFRKIPLSGNYTDVHAYMNDLSNASKDSAEKFLFSCEFLLSLFHQSTDVLKSLRNKALARKVIETVKVIDCDLSKLNLVRKTVSDEEFGEVFVILPNNAVLESALTIVDESTIQDRLIEYSSSHNEGNIKRKEELLILLQKYIEGITKDKKYRDLNKRLFENVDMLYNNLDLRHNKDIKGKEFFEFTKDNREHWLDMLYDLSLLVINSKNEWKFNEEIREAKRRSFGDK